jgi:hypothetical protein
MLSEIKKYQKEIDCLRHRIKDFVTPWSTDDILLRYLKARNFDYDKSEHMLKESLKWRAEYKPDQITSDDDSVKKSKKLKQLYKVGHCKTGEPIFYVVPAPNPYPTDVRIRYLLWALEEAIRRMAAEGCESGKMVWLMDMSHFGKDTLADSYGVDVAKQTLNILQNHYPERLLKFLVMDSPWYFQLFWNIVQLFIDPKTKEKIIFCNSHNREKLLSSIVEKKELLQEYGGYIKITEDMKADWDTIDESKLQRFPPPLTSTKQQSKSSFFSSHYASRNAITPTPTYDHSLSQSDGLLVSSSTTTFEINVENNAASLNLTTEEKNQGNLDIMSPRSIDGGSNNVVQPSSSSSRLSIDGESANTGVIHNASNRAKES